MKRITLAAVAALSLSACDNQPSPRPAPPGVSMVVNGQEVNAPAGSTVVLQTETTSLGGETRTEREASGTGASINTTSDEAALKFDASAPKTSLSGEDGGTSFGGSFSVDADLRRVATNPFAWAAVAALLGAAIAAYFRNVRAAVVLGGVAGVLFAAAVMPGWATFLVAAGAAGVCGYALWADLRGERRHEALRAVVGGIAESAQHVQTAVKAEIAKQADRADRDTIRAVKRADGY